MLENRGRTGGDSRESPPDSRDSLFGRNPIFDNQVFGLSPSILTETEHNRANRAANRPEPNTKNGENSGCHQLCGITRP